MAFPVFAPGDVLNASDMNAVGLWKITAVTVSATTVAVNNCFTADYDHYLVKFVGIASSAGDIYFRLRVGGVDESGASAYRNGRMIVGLNSSLTFASTNNATNNHGQVPNISQTANNVSVFDLHVFNPAKTTWTQGICHSAGNFIALSGLTLQNTTAYDGFSLTNTNLTGTVTVYGFRV
jgi:hypothetical protein